MKDKIRIILFEDNKNYGEAFQEAFEDSSKVYVCQVFESADRAVSKIKEYSPDVVLMDIEMPNGDSGLDALKKIKKELPDTKVLIQTQFEDEHRIFVALCRGACGYIIKSDSFDKIEEAIENAFHKRGYLSSKIAAKIINFFSSSMVQANPEYIPLTDKELEVLKNLKKLGTYQKVAEEIHLSYEGVHSHVKNVYIKLRVNSKTEAILKAIELKLI